MTAPLNPDFKCPECGETENFVVRSDFFYSYSYAEDMTIKFDGDMWKKIFTVPAAVLYRRRWEPGFFTGVECSCGIVFC